MEETDKSGTYRTLSPDKVTKEINKISASRNKRLSPGRGSAALGLLQGFEN